MKFICIRFPLFHDYMRLNLALAGTVRELILVKVAMEVKIVEPHENNDNTKEQKIYDILAYLMFNSLNSSGPFVVATNLLASY